jgi:hypothetical protein
MLGRKREKNVESVKRMFYTMKQKGFQSNKFIFKAILDAYKNVEKFDLC